MNATESAPAERPEREFIVEMHGEVREVYLVTAASPEEAQETWSDGALLNSEASSMEIYSVREDTSGV